MLQKYKLKMSDAENSLSDDELGELPIIAKYDIQSSSVSGWDDETEGVEEELNPHGKHSFDQSYLSNKT